MQKIRPAILPEAGLVFRADFVRASAKANRRVVHLAALKQRALCRDQAECLATRWADCWLPRAARDFQNLDLRLMLVSACQTPRAQVTLLAVAVSSPLALPQGLQSDWPVPVSSTPDHEE